jgi:hypothetical protein
MTPFRARWTLATLVTASALALGGCSQPKAMAGLTAETAETETNAISVNAIAAIDPTVITRIDRLSDQSVSSYGSDVDQHGRYRQWTRTDYVWLTLGTKQLDILSTLVQSYVDKGWVVTWDKSASSEGGRTVQLLKENRRAGETYGLSFTAADNDRAPAVLNIGSTSPVFFDPTR